MTRSPRSWGSPGASPRSRLRHSVDRRVAWDAPTSARRPRRRRRRRCVVVHLAWLIQPSRDEPRCAPPMSRAPARRRPVASHRRASVRRTPRRSASTRPRRRTSAARRVLAGHRDRVEHVLAAQGRGRGDARRVRARAPGHPRRADAHQPRVPTRRRRPRSIACSSGDSCPGTCRDRSGSSRGSPRLAFQATHADDVADAYRPRVTPTPGAFNVAAEPVLTPALIARPSGAPVPCREARSCALRPRHYRLRLQPTSPGWFDMATRHAVMDTLAPTRARLEAAASVRRRARRTARRHRRRRRRRHHFAATALIDRRLRRPDLRVETDMSVLGPRVPTLSGDSNGDPASARRFVHDALAGTVSDAVSGDLQLAASELVTNAVRHALPSPVRVTVRGQRTTRIGDGGENEQPARHVGRCGHLGDVAARPGRRPRPRNRACRVRRHRRRARRNDLVDHRPSKPAVGQLRSEPDVSVLPLGRDGPGVNCDRRPQTNQAARPPMRAGPPAPATPPPPSGRAARSSSRRAGRSGADRRGRRSSRSSRSRSPDRRPGLDRQPRHSCRPENRARCPDPRARRRREGNPRHRREHEQQRPDDADQWPSDARLGCTRSGRAAPARTIARASSPRGTWRRRACPRPPERP